MVWKQEKIKKLKKVRKKYEKNIFSVDIVNFWSYVMWKKDNGEKN